MLGDVDVLVDSIIKADRDANGRLKILLVGGAGVTIASCLHAKSKTDYTWRGLIRQALEHIAAHPNVRDPAVHARLKASAQKCTQTNNPQELIALCDAVEAAFASAGLHLSDWIHDTLAGWSTELEQRWRQRRTRAPLLNTIRDWQADFGAVVATTNYDDLLSIAQCGTPSDLSDPELTADPDRALEALLDGSPNVLHLHGRYDRTGTAIFSKADYERLIERNRKPDSFAQRVFNATFPIFIGCGAGIGDDDIASLIGRRDVGDRQGLRRAQVLRCERETHLPDLRADIFQNKCIDIVYGDEFRDLVPFLRKARQRLLERGFRRPQRQRASIHAQQWLARRNRILAEAPITAPCPPIEMDKAISELPLRRFFGTVLRSVVPDFELEAIGKVLQGPDALAALPTDPRFDVVTPRHLLASPLSILLGDGGSGKTSLLKLLLKQALKWRPGSLPIYVRAADYLASRLGPEGKRPTDLHHYLMQNLAQPISGAGQPPPEADLAGAYGAAAADGKLIVMIDGLDEIASPSDRSTLVAEIMALFANLEAEARGGMPAATSNHLIVTSRFSGYRAASITHPLAKHFVLSPLTITQVNRLHDQVFAALIKAGVAPSGALRSSRRQLREKLQTIRIEQPASADWIDTPILAILVAFAFLADGALPQSREGVFQKILSLSCRYLLDHPAVPAAPDADRLAALFAHIAHRIFTSRTGEVFSQATIEALLYEDGIEGASGFVALLSSDRSLLRGRSPGYFGFIHRGILEYLCGQKLSEDIAQLVEASLDPSWQQAAAFGCAAALRGASGDELANAMAKACTVPNGARPVIALLRGTFYAEPLPPRAYAAAAGALIEGLSVLAEEIGDEPVHPQLNRLFATLRSEGLNGAIQAQVFDLLGRPDTAPDQLRAALLLSEGLLEPSETLLTTIDRARERLPAHLCAVAERIQRTIVRRLLTSAPVAKAVLPFAREVDLHWPGILPERLAPWRRVLLTLAGGVIDHRQPELQRQGNIVARFLNDDDERRNMLLPTMSDRLRNLALDQEDAIVEHAMQRSRSPMTELEARRQQRNNPDVTMGLAIYLDNTEGATRSALEHEPIFETRALHRTPGLRLAILDTLEKGKSPSSTMGRKSARSTEEVERALIDLVLGGSGSGSGCCVTEIKRAANGLADAAVRGIASVERQLEQASGRLEAEERLTLADALQAMKLHFGIWAKVSTEGDADVSVSAPLGLVDYAAEALSGLDSEDAIYNAMLFLDRVQGQRRIAPLAELQTSRLVSAQFASWDLAPLPIPHLGDLAVTRLGAVLDLLEACPPAISAVRSDTLKALLEGADAAAEPDARVEIEALLSLDWGAQALEDAQASARSPIWDNMADLVLAKARKAKSSIWKVRALARLLRPVPAAERPAREAEILEVIGLLDEPFEQVLGLEQLAVHGAIENGQGHALRAMETLAKLSKGLRHSGRQLPDDHERWARAYARLSVWLPTPVRQDALRLAMMWTAGAAAADPRHRFLILLRALRPYARRDEVAWREWEHLVRQLNPIDRAFVRDRRGEAMAYVLDGPLGDSDLASSGYGDPLIAYCRLLDAMRDKGAALEPWELLERAEITPESVERIKGAFTAETPPRLTHAGLIVLRELAEAGWADMVGFVLGRVARHPPGAATLLHSIGEDDLARVVRAANRGLEEAVVHSAVKLLDDPEPHRQALANTVLDLPPQLRFHDNDFQARQRIYSYRRSTIVGFDTILALAQAAHRHDCSSAAAQRIRWYCSHILLETEAEAPTLIKATRDLTRREGAMWLLGGAAATTPQFLSVLLSGAPANDEDVQLGVLRQVASFLTATPDARALLEANGVLARAAELLASQPRLHRRIFSGGAKDVATFLADARTLEPAVMDTAFIARSWEGPAAAEQIADVLEQWDRSHRWAFRPEKTAEIEAAADMLAGSEDAIMALIGYCAHHARARSPLKDSGGSLAHYTWPLAAALVERCPASLALGLNRAGVFEMLPHLATGRSGWAVRRSALLLMPLEWRELRGRTSLDALRAILAASNDVWMVCEAAYSLVGQIRWVGQTALAALDPLRARGGLAALFGVRILFSIANNSQTPDGQRELAHSLLEQALHSDAAARLIEYPVATVAVPPRMRLRDAIINEALRANF